MILPTPRILYPIHGKRQAKNRYFDVFVPLLVNARCLIWIRLPLSMPMRFLHSQSTRRPSRMLKSLIICSFQQCRSRPLPILRYLNIFFLQRAHLIVSIYDSYRVRIDHTGRYWRSSTRSSTTGKPSILIVPGRGQWFLLRANMRMAWDYLTTMIVLVSRSSFLFSRYTPAGTWVRSMLMLRSDMPKHMTRLPVIS